MLTGFRLSAAERRFALTSFAVKATIFWIAQLVVCVLDPRRLVCGVVEKGFLPCLISFGDGFPSDPSTTAPLGPLAPLPDTQPPG